jgi:tetratricopeptide (TPR) repeat protein
LPRYCYLFLPIGIVLLAVLLLTQSCSSEQNTVAGSVYHNMAAHYNGYFYAREKNREVHNLIWKNWDDDPSIILRLFPKLDTVSAKAYAKDTEEVIKMASISIQRHPNSHWVDDNYVQVGIARLHACDYSNAIQTFKFVNTKGTTPSIRHEALIYLLRTFTEQGDFAKAEETFRFLEKENLSKDHQKRLFIEKAYYYQLQTDYDNMVRNLSAADSLLTRHDRKARIYFIIGQVYQQLGFQAEAYNFYKKCLSARPDYEIDFYARLNLAQVTSLTDKKDVRTARKQFDKLLNDSKNLEFRDKIYYELGEFERKQGNLPQAITDYQLAAHAGTNKRVQGFSYLRLGQIYFDSLKKYSLAKLYYDSTVGVLPKETEGYAFIKKRQEVLGDFAKYTETITLNDSLLYLAQFDSLTIRNRLDSAIAKATPPKVKGKRKRTFTPASSAGSGINNNPFATSNQTESTVEWYFGNAAAVSLGQSEFQRIWGTRVLTDDWRRSNRALPTANEEVAEKPAEVTAATEKKDNPATDKVGQMILKVPRSEAQRAELLKAIEEAYFKLGDLHYFQLTEKENAAIYYKKVIARFPTSSLEPEVLYKLYLIYKDTDDTMAKQYASQLAEAHPSSTYARILANPDYLKEASEAAEKQKIIYKDAYAAYQANNLRMAQDKLALAYQIGETAFTPQLDLLKVLMVGRTEDATRYQFELGVFVKKYPDHELRGYADKLLASSRDLLQRIDKAKGIQFVKSFDEPHYFVTVYDSKEKLTNDVVNALERYNARQFTALKLTTSNLVVNEEKTLTMVLEFKNREAALDYFDKFVALSAQWKPFSSYKFYNFVITKDNFQIFYRNRALDEYLSFFDRNYQKQSQ